VPKAYWVSVYRSIKDEQKLASYAQLAGPAIADGGGKFLARGTADQAFEDGQKLRTVIVEFASFNAALQARNSKAYGKALAVLGDSVIRDFRIVEGT
jgi:uncharacterized protein (DUF1330 family)